MQTRALSVLATISMIGASLVAQCETPWSSLAPSRSVTGEILAMERWDSDGPGPMPEEVLVAGDFVLAGGETHHNLAAYDPTTGSWRSVGGPVDGPVHSVDLLPNGGVVIGGEFAMVAGVSAIGVAVWDGTAWSGLGNAQGVRAVLATSGGEVVVGGLFTSVAGVPAHNVARWDGAAWHAMGAGLVDLTPAPGLQEPGIADLAELSTGDLIAVGGIVDFVSVWDGTGWLANPPTGSWFAADAVLPEANGGYVIAGYETGGRPIARWNGTSWWRMPSLLARFRSVAAMGNGDLIAGYDQAANGGGVLRLQVGGGRLGWVNGRAAVHAVLPWGSQRDEFFAGGRATQLGATPGQNLFWFDGSRLQGADPMFNGTARYVGLPSGVYVYGDFSRIHGAPINRVARWDNGWQQVGNGTISDCHAVTELPNGDLMASCTSGAYRFDGNSWTLVPGIFGGNTRDIMAANAAGQILLADRRGQQGLLLYDGSSWSEVNPSNPIRGVAAIAAHPDGSFVLTACCFSTFPINGGRIARFDGAGFTALDPGWTVATPGSVAVDAAGAIYVTSRSAISTQPRGVMRFDGNAWTLAGALNDWPAVLATDTAGNVYAAGGFTQDGSRACRHLGRWDGTGWQPLAGGAPISVGGLAISPRGDVFAGGAEDFLLHRTACPATASSYAPGCSGSGGPNELHVSTLPLIGGTYRAEATGLPTSALAIDLFGLNPASQPLINLVPFGVPGCTVAVTPVVSVSRLASGSFTTTLAITNDPVWIGTAIRHQVLVGELGGPGFLAATVTNAIAAVLGRAY